MIVGQERPTSGSLELGETVRLSYVDSNVGEVALRDPTCLGLPQGWDYRREPLCPRRLVRRGLHALPVAEHGRSRPTTNAPT